MRICGEDVELLFPILLGSDDQWLSDIGLSWCKMIQGMYMVLM